MKEVVTAAIARVNEMRNSHLSQDEMSAESSRFADEFGQLFPRCVALLNVV